MITPPPPPAVAPRRSHWLVALLAGTPLLACVIALAGSCGTLATHATGDVDLPNNLLGPFRPLMSSEAPNSSTTLVQSFSTPIDEPSVVTAGSRRAMFVSWTESNGRRSIAVTRESMDPPAGGLAPFDAPTVILAPELPWEQDTVSAPGAAVLPSGEVVVAYAGGGAIGLATSGAGGTPPFHREPNPVLTADASQGENGPLEAPSLARAPTGEWFLAYASSAQIFLARAPAPTGPWTRIDADPSTPARDAVLAPLSDVAADAGAAFEMLAVGDPALAIQELPSGRVLFRLFYTATGPMPLTVVSVAASFDAGCSAATSAQPCFARAGRIAYSERTRTVRAGSFELVDGRIGLLWFSAGPTASRIVSAAVAPETARLADLSSPTM
jgi:hypothetical protein